MKTLYRLSVGAPSVDFYFLQSIETNQGSPDTYRLYLIQMTVAKKHKVDSAEIKNYLLKINGRIEGNDEICQQIETCRNSDDLEMLRDQNSWVEQDKGKEPKLPLQHTDVKIWFLYIQETINDKFDGKVVKWCAHGTRTKGDTGLDIGDVLMLKVKNVYGVATHAQ